MPSSLSSHHHQERLVVDAAVCQRAVIVDRPAVKPERLLLRRSARLVLDHIPDGRDRVGRLDMKLHRITRLSVDKNIEF